MSISNKSRSIGENGWEGVGAEGSDSKSVLNMSVLLDAVMYLC
jgi:hypothetical protein